MVRGLSFQTCLLVLVLSSLPSESFPVMSSSSTLNGDSRNEGGTQQNKGESDEAVITVGLIADIQYAPVPDGFSYAGVKRYYRNSLKTARHAFSHFQKDNLRLVVNLGDTLDGKCQQLDEHKGDSSGSEDPSLYSLKHVLDAMSPYKGHILHAHGNHCLYNMNRAQLRELLGITFVTEPDGEQVGYDSYTLEKTRFILLDTYDISLLRPRKSIKFQQAHRIMSKHNPNYPSSSNSPEGLTGLNRRFVGFNGAVGSLQLQWFHKQLTEVRAAGERAVIVSHPPIHPDSSSPTCLIWNYADVLRKLREFSDVVLLSLAGHAHKGGYVRDDESGIHFRVLEASLETIEETYALLDIQNDSVTIRGFGSCKSAVYDLYHMGTDATYKPPTK